MLTFRDFTNGLRKLEIDRARPVIAHASLSAFGQVHGGADTLLGALLTSFNALIMPTFTYNTMIIPESGPADNGITYGSGKDTNRMATFFQADLPADKTMGVVAEALRRNAKAHRSAHPIMSFAGINAAQALDAQALDDPLRPIHVFNEDKGWVLLLGVDHTVNTSMHYAEKIAGRRQFTRWALTPDGVAECKGFPGCSDGFQAVTPFLEGFVRWVQVGEGIITAIPLVEMVDFVSEAVREAPLALLCARQDCGRCNAVRESVNGK